MPITVETPPTPLELASERLALYLKAERAILDGNQAYEINGRRLTRADLEVVARTISEIRAEITLLASIRRPGGRFGYIRHGDRRR